MATRSVIGITDRNGDGQLIFCFFNGYPHGVGLTLLQHWQDESKVRELMALGELSILGPEIGEQVDFDTFHGGLFSTDTAHPKYGNQCLAYGRDRSEKDVDAKSFTDGHLGFLTLTKERYSDVRYGYLWTPDGWFGVKLPHEWARDFVSEDTAPALESLSSMAKASMNYENEYRIREGYEPFAMPAELANAA